MECIPSQIKQVIEDQGGTCSLQGLATHFSVDPKMMAIMLEGLVQQGYIRKRTSACDARKGCAGCYQEVYE